VAVVAADEVERRCGSDAHQGVCAEVDPYPYADGAELLAAPDPLIVALDEVTDPQNLGAVARTAEAVGATGLVIPERRSAEVTAAVCKASAGAVEHLPVARVRNLADWLGTAKERQSTWVYGAAAEAKVPYERPDYRGRVVLVLGSEGRGLRPRVSETCDELVALPNKGQVGSLNVSTAAAALVYGILHFRK
jgi:23S rRNA (guanosine2251-2'-O)-methyltransferase